MNQTNVAGGPNHWWPKDFGTPSSNGSDESLRYAYFPLMSRLVIERDGAQMIYDTGDYQFRGALQANSRDANLTFATQRGRISLKDLPVIT